MGKQENKSEVELELEKGVEKDGNVDVNVKIDVKGDGDVNVDKDRCVNVVESNQNNKSNNIWRRDRNEISTETETAEEEDMLHLARLDGSTLNRFDEEIDIP